jgi:hypothetical protein
MAQPMRPAPLRQPPRPSAPIQPNPVPGRQFVQPTMQQYNPQPSAPNIPNHFDNQNTFEEPQASQEHPFEVEMPAENNEDSYYNYGSIDFSEQNSYQHEQNHADLQNVNQIDNQSYDEMAVDLDPNPPQYDTGNKTDLDMEIEKYQREIEEKQRKMRSQSTSQSPAAPQYMPQRPQNLYQQPTQRQAPQQMIRPQPQHHGYAPHQASPAEEDYDVYNVEISSCSQQDQQKKNQQVTDNQDEAMFFTSVDTDRQKRPARRPINPRIKPQKGFLSKFFNKEDPE